MKILEVHIRKAVYTDCEAICELFNEVIELHSGYLPGIFQRPDSPVRQPDYYRELIGDENVGLFVAEAEENIIGFVHVATEDAPSSPIFVPRRYAFVNGIAVKSGFQNRGVGQQLMGMAQEWAIAKGMSSLELNVYEFNQVAIAFYHKIGFETLSRKMGKRLQV